MEEFKQKYIEEASEIIAALEEAILKLEENPEKNEVIEEVFRSMHTLKGGAAMFGFEKIRDITHELENAYDLIRNKKKKISNKLLNITLECIDYFKKLLTDEENEEENDDNYCENLIDRITKDLDAPINQKETEKNKIKNSSKKKTEDINQTQNLFNTYYIFFAPHKEVLQNGTNPLLLIEELCNLGTSKVYSFVNNIPNLNDLKVDELFIGWHIILAAPVQKEAISDIFIFVEDDSELNIQMLSKDNLFDNENFFEKAEKMLEGHSHSAIAKLQSLINNEESNENELTEQDKNDEEQPSVNTLLEEKENEEIDEEISVIDKKNNKGKEKKDSIQSLRISADKVDDLMNIVSELVTTQARLKLFTEEHQIQGLEIISENIQKLTSRLRDNAFDLSLVPLQSIVTRFQRMVRDLSAELGKEIIFNTKGTETELDKSIIENLSDPIMHILRNSIDHGIEDKKTREKSGKPPKGEISLKAYYSGANVYIEISDDGKGIDHKIIREKAIRKGMINKETPMSKRELFELIFIPGFSTSNNITEISGRGVGMDVVLDKISEIRGEVEVSSELGSGTIMTIKLPLTLSILDGLLAKIGDTNYIIPLSVVDEIHIVRHNELVDTFYNTIIINGRQIPYYSLRDEFNEESECPVKEQVVIVSFEDKQLGIVVDKVVGEYQAVLKPLGKHYRKLQIFSGGTILGDGTVALVMDTNKMIKKFSNKINQEVNHEK